MSLYLNPLTHGPSRQNLEELPLNLRFPNHQAMVLRPGGTTTARAVLNAQLVAWWKVNDDDDDE
jgi:hypothetical protein